MYTRELNSKDAKECYDLRLEALLNSPDAFITTYEQEKQRPDPIKTFEDRLDSNESHTFGIFEDHNLKGVVTLVQETHPKFAHKASIVAMYVTPAYRRSGAGEKLMQEAINFARAINIEILQLSVVSENKPAKYLYEKMGFNGFAFEKHAIKLAQRYLDEEHMAKFLQEN